VFCFSQSVQKRSSRVASNAFHFRRACAKDTRLLHQTRLTSAITLENGDLYSRMRWLHDSRLRRNYRGLSISGTLAGFRAQILRSQHEIRWENISGHCTPLYGILSTLAIRWSCLLPLYRTPFRRGSQCPSR